ncbi:MAG TPA: hypothetical protein VLE97_08715 [Gaiellaceae bacterium]|nr:hypothetical protein [Gaiellaceae bacterium]
MSERIIDACVLAIEPHPDQATNNPGSWAVQFEVSYDGRRRTFWRWYTDRKVRHGSTHAERNPKPREADILRRFWDDTFAELHGFAFDKDSP